MGRPAATVPRRGKIQHVELYILNTGYLACTEKQAVEDTQEDI